MAYPPITCQRCGKVFVARPSNHGLARKFCSVACYSASCRKPPVTRSCEWCGKPYTIKHSLVKSRHCCSVGCMRARLRVIWASRRGKRHHRWKGGPLKIKCAWCGKEFVAVRTRQHPRKYCSLYCAHEARFNHGKTSICAGCGKEFVSARRGKSRLKCCSPECVLLTSSGPRNANWLGGMVSLICEQCGAPFKVKLHEAKIAKYCSLRCTGLAVLGDRSPNWRGGGSGTSYSKTWARSVRESAGNRCQMCGTDKGEMHAHHILSRAEYPDLRNDPSNGMCLCVSCHMAVHHEAQPLQLVMAV